MFCAISYPHQYTETQDGFEMIFSLYYLSRYLLSYGLNDLLEKSQNPIVFNVAAPGRTGEIQWDDLNFRENFNVMQASFHGSRLNDLSGVAFVESVKPTRIKYILYNPGFVVTEGLTKFIDISTISISGISPEESASLIMNRLENPPTDPPSAYEQQKPVPLTIETFNRENAQRLYQLTENMLRARTG